MKKFFRYILAAALVLPLFACAADPAEETDRLSIVSVSFPTFDFARAVVGDLADVTMLLDPGTESHSFDPSPKDIRKIQSCDVFLYGGGESDAWVDNILSSLDTENIRILSMMETVSLFEEETKEGMTAEEHEAEHEHADTYDEHVWTSPANAAAITEAICSAVCAVDSEHEEDYRANADAYIEALNALSADFADCIAQADRHTLIFADRFPFLYFVRAFGLDYYAAFPGCAEQTEPGAQTIAYLTKKVRDEQIPVVFYTEFSNQQLADSICEATGAEKLLFHSCHNVSKSDYDAGVTYVSLMRQNLENLRKALS